MPSDLYPEGLVGVRGYSDDLVHAALVLHRTLPALSPEVLADCWRGEGDVHQVVEEIRQPGPRPSPARRLFERFRGWADAG